MDARGNRIGRAAAAFGIAVAIAAILAARSCAPAPTSEAPPHASPQQTEAVETGGRGADREPSPQKEEPASDGTGKRTGSLPDTPQDTISRTRRRETAASQDEAAPSDGGSMAVPPAPSAPESGSGGQGGSSGDAPAPTPGKRTCQACGGTGSVRTGSRTVTDSAAWDEWVVDSPAWDEWVVDSPAWNETVYLGIQFSDGTFFAAGDEASADAYEESVILAGGSISSSNVYGSVHHDEVGHTVHHDETGHAVHHDAVTHTEDVYGTCPACGGSGTV